MKKMPKLPKINLPDLKSLGLDKFLKMGSLREKIIKTASDKKIPELESYAPNAMAFANHPKEQHLIITDVIDHENGFKSFVFGPDSSMGTEKLAYFNAGDYISLTIQIGKSIITRPYSFASSPKESLEGKYMVSIKKVDGGFSSEYIFDNWTVGTKITASAPLDMLSYEALRDAPTIVAVAGGSGITPFYSMAQAIRDGFEDFNLVLLYGTRTLKDAVFLEEMHEIEKSCPKFKMINILSEESIETAKKLTFDFLDELSLEEGFITAEIIKKYAPENAEYSVFMCGPGAMYKAVSKECEKLGIKKRLIRYGAAEEYNPLKAEDFPKEKSGTYSLTVKMHDRVQTISCSSDEPLLVALERAGIKAPSQCRRGTCGWCRSKLVSRSDSVFIPADIDKRRAADKTYGYIHPCCTFPIGNVIIYLE